MKVGFAVESNEGVDSKVYGHFGSAPMFLVVDEGVATISTVRNKDLNHVHGACNPIRALDGNRIEVMIVGGIGAGALRKLNAMGIRVFGAAASSVRENLALLGENKLHELTADHACRAHQGGCGH